MNGMTKEQRALTRSPVRVADDTWFYVNRGMCSFHDGKKNHHVHGIPLTAILKALTRTGLLDIWDSKKMRYKPSRKVQP